jgi:hypothetical protein
MLEIPKNFPTQPALNTTAGNFFKALTHGIPDMKDWPVKNETEVQDLIDAKGGLVPNFYRTNGDWPNIEITAFNLIDTDNMNYGNIGKNHTRTNATKAYQAFIIKYFGLDGRQAEGVRANNDPAPAAAPVAAPTVVEAAPTPPTPSPAPTTSPAATGASATSVTLGDGSPSLSETTRSRVGKGAGLGLAMTEGTKNDHPPAVPLIRPPNINLEREAHWLGTRPTWSGKGWLDICEQEWLDAFKLLGGVPDWYEFVDGRDNWEHLMQGFEMPELEKKIVNLIRST